MQVIAAPAGEIHVCTEGAPMCDYTSVQDAVDAADEGDVIKVAAGTYADIHQRNGITQVVYINKTVTVRGGYTTTNWGTSDPVGNPTTLDAQGNGRVLYITGNISPTIESLRITGGDANGLGGNYEDAGGGVYIGNARAIISNSQIFSNTAAEGGGLVIDGDAELYGNTILSNIADHGGGLLVGYSIRATIDGNTIAHNTARDNGGGLYVFLNAAPMIRYNTIAHNTAILGMGGGLFLSDSDDATVIGNTVVSNEALIDGGGLYLSSSDATVSNNTFSNNTSGDDGGGVYLSYSDATVSNNAFSNNSSMDRGGGVYLSYSDALLNGNIIISNTVSDGDPQNGGGGGVYFYYSDATLASNVIADNRAALWGGGLFAYSSSPLLLHTTIARNASIFDSGIFVYGVYRDSHVALSNTIVADQLVGIYVIGDNEAILEATLWDWANMWDWRGDGTILTGTVNIWGDPAFTDPDSGDYHIGSTSDALDAGIDVGVTRDIDGQIRPMDWGYDIGADEYRGVGLEISKESSELLVNRGQTFTYILVITSVGTGDATSVIVTDTLDGWQRAVGAVSSLGGCAVVDAGWGGSVVCSPGTLSPGARAIITLTAQVSTTVAPWQAMVNTAVARANETMNGSQSTTYGEDCHVRLNDEPTEYTNVQIAVDAAEPGDVVKIAGICLGASGTGRWRQQAYVDKSLTIQGGYTITNWTTPDPDANPTTLDVGGQGRVLYITGDPSVAGQSISATVEGLRIVGGNVGGVGTSLYENTGGGGVYVMRANVIISHCHVLSNSADYGGGVYAAVSDVTLYNNTISGNDAWFSGGGLYLLSPSDDATLSNNTISGNSADDDGGGGYLSNSNATLVNNVIVDNYADYAGCGLYITSASSRLIHNTIARNMGNGSVLYGRGSGLYVGRYSTVALTNTILVSHTVGIYVDSGNAASLEATLWGTGTWANATDWSGLGTIITGSVDIWDDPAFIDPDARDYHISLESAAIDKGIDAGVREDIDGERRPQSGGYDLGADEAGLVVTKWANPDPAQPGAPLTYTISIVNTSDVTLTATITDILPLQVTPSGHLTWIKSITAPGGVWTEQFTVTVNVGYVGVLTNVVQVTTDEGVTGAYTHTVNVFPTVDFGNPVYRVGESDDSATITVTLSQVSALTTTVDYAASGGTASPGDDYTAFGGELVFTPGITTQTFNIAITNDELDEYDETVALTLYSATNATVGSNTPATLTIDDDDDPPSVSISDASVTEGSSGSTNAVFSVTLSIVSGKPVTVEYSTASGSASAPSDYIAIPVTVLVFAPGETERSINVTVQGDTMDEFNETFLVNLSSAENAGIVDGQGQGIIEDDDDLPTVAFNSATYSVNEEGGIAIITVTLNAPSGKTVTVHYATSDGTATAGSDYTDASDVLTFTPGVTVQTFTIAIANDALDENDETVILTLSNPDNATIGDNNPAVLTITDNDDPPVVDFSGAAYSVGEDEGSATISVVLSTASGLTVTVEYSTTNGTATAGEDHTDVSGTLIFTPGITSQVITIPITNDTLDENAETVILTLSSPDNATIGGNNPAALTITDNDSPPTVDFSSAAYIVGEDAGSATIDVALSAVSGLTITVEYSTTNGTATAGEDYAATSGTLTFTPGVTSQSFAVAITEDEVEEGEETVTLTLFNAENATISSNNPAVLTITEDFKVYLPLVLRQYP